MITLEAVRATGVLDAVIDGPNHVSVRPTNPAKMPEWIATRPTALQNPHEYTLLLSEISIKVNASGSVRP